MSVAAPSYTAVAGATSLAVEDDSGEVSLDAGRSPHVAGSLSVSGGAATLALLDARTSPPPRVVLTCGGRTFDLTVRGARRAHDGDVVTVDLASDEALLDDYRPLTDDGSCFAVQGSARSVVAYVINKAIPGAVLQASPSVDASWQRAEDSINLVPNGSFEVDLSGWWAGSGTVMNRASDWAADGSWCARLEPNGTTNVTYIETGNLLGGAVTSGKTYMVRATERLAAAQTGTLHPSARRLEVYYRIGNGAYTSLLTDQPANAVGVYEHVLRFTVPTGVTELKVRLWNGASTTSWTRWDAVRLSEASADTADTGYYGGNTPATSRYVYTWTGTAGASTAVRTALVDRPAEALLWRAGQSAMEFLHPLLQASGLRLVCDEQRRWTLRDDTYRAPGAVSIRDGVNLVDGEENISRDDESWFDARVTRYGWTDRNGVRQTRDDAYALTPSFTRATLMEIEAPYPGPGRSQYAVQRAQGRGRDVKVEAMADWTVAAEAPLEARLQGSPVLEGTVQSVRFDLASDRMQITSRTVELRPGTIDALSGTIDALAGAIDSL